MINVVAIVITIQSDRHKNKLDVAVTIATPYRNLKPCNKAQ